MSAQDVIEQIKSMPPQEREEVAEYVRNSASDQPPLPKTPRPDVKALIKKIFREHDELFRKLAQ